MKKHLKFFIEALVKIIPIAFTISSLIIPIHIILFHYIFDVYNDNSFTSILETTSFLLILVAFLVGLTIFFIFPIFLIIHFYFVSRKKHYRNERDLNIEQNRLIILPIDIKQSYKISKESLKTLENIKRINVDRKDMIQVKTKMNFQSNGDTITYELIQIDDHHSLIMLYITQSWPTQVVDFGNNYNDIERIIKFIKSKYRDAFVKVY